jgi:hypothetical protein
MRSASGGVVQGDAFAQGVRGEALVPVARGDALVEDVGGARRHRAFSEA